VCVSRHRASTKSISFLRRAAVLCAALLLSACTGFSFTEKETPLLSLPGKETAEGGGKTRDPGGNGALNAASEKASAEAGREQVMLGSGQFFKAPKGKGAEVTGEGDVELNFAEANVREVAQEVLGKLLGQNVVVDSGIEQRITLRTNKPLKRDNLIPALETTLAAAGLALVRDGELYRILPSSKAKNGSAKALTLAGQGRLQAGYSVVAVRLDYIAPSQMAKILEPLAPDKSVLRVDDARNLIIVAGTGPEMEALAQTIETFDVNPLKGMSFGYFKLHHARSSQVMGELKDFVRAYGHQTGFNAPQIVPVERLNAFLVFASHAETLKLVQGWVRRLDVDKNELDAQVYVYRVKNRKAKELAALLSNLFQTGAGGSGLSGTGDTPPDTKTVDVSTPPASGLRSSPTQPAATPAADVRSTPVPDTGQGLTQGTQGLRIVADTINNSLLIRATPKDYQTITAALTRLDTVPPLVMIEVTIAEVTLNDQLQYGVEWFFKKKQQSATLSSLDTGQVLSKFPGFSYFFNATDIQVVLNAMSGVTNVKVLSSPKVMVLDNKTATLQIGDQVPVVTASSQSVSSSGAPVIQTVQYYDTGVILKVTPQVNSGGLISMDINQEVSNVATGQSDNSTGSPTIQQRKISSAIAIQSGQAVVLGGLIRDSKTVSTTGVPWLSDIPKVGDVFKTHDNQTQRTELIVMITPRVVWDRSEAREASDEIQSKMQSIFGKR
jgi:general secretion pathway protein D